MKEILFINYKKNPIKTKIWAQRKIQKNKKTQKPNIKKKKKKEKNLLDFFGQGLN